MIHHSSSPTTDTFQSLSNLAAKNAGSFVLNTTSRLPPQSPTETSSSPRSQILQLGCDVGTLCTAMLSHSPPDPTPPPKKSTSPPPSADDSIPKESDTMAVHDFWTVPSDGRNIIFESIAKVFWRLVVICHVCQIDLRSCILKKMELNNRKYPVALCKGRSGKYTVYSAQTGVTKQNQSTLDINLDDEKKECTTSTSSTSPLSVSDLQHRIHLFAKDRLWSKYHTPRNIVLALIGEMGELAELFQWRGDGDDDVGLKHWTEEDVDSVQQEVADVAIYCLRLATVVGIEDLGGLVIGFISTDEKCY